MESKKLTIFFTSDLHAYIYPTDYRSREERDIGLFKCASRFTRDGNTLIIDGGDLLQGSPLGAFCHDTVGSAARFLVHYLTGVFVWGEYMPETFFGMTMTTPWFYSALYNGSYMLLDLVFCLLLGWLLWKPLGKYIRGEDIRPKDATK